MKTTLTISRRGVVTLPAKLRLAVGIRGDDQLIAEATAEGILLRPAVTLPVELYPPERVQAFDEEEAAVAKLLNEALPVGDQRAARKRATNAAKKKK